MSPNLKYTFISYLFHNRSNLSQSKNIISVSLRMNRQYDITAFGLNPGDTSKCFVLVGKEG